MVASVGLCPFYKNEKPSVEIHMIHEFPEDFYGATLKGMPECFQLRSFVLDHEY